VFTDSAEYVTKLSLNGDMRI